ncbi:MAG: hypothetical protein IKF61_01965 [Firmicutes bacterium]|nr:hypothetical protein [Bacillota bacterium]MBR3260318.1 hypothetical protein [Bacillota bacterium]MBR3374463.1 hypothetical protein [Bacillota bacterium]
MIYTPESEFTPNLGLDHNERRMDLRTKLNATLIERKDYLNRIQQEKEEALKSAPAGNLRISNNKGKIRHYQVVTKGSHSGKYIREKDYPTAIKLAQKAYDLKVLKNIKKEILQIDNYCKLMETDCVEGIYDNLSEERKRMVEPICLPDEDFIKNWLERDYEKMGFADGEPAYDTVVGTRVRSKSEALISNSLERWEVPQLYEVPLILKGYGKVRPDFMVLNVRTRQEYIWEHLGMLDDPVYLEKAMKKIEAYIANGYIPGINLIITFESSKHPLNLNTVDKLIETFLK